MSWSQTFAARRRRIVKRCGRALIKATANLVSRQSLVADRPVHDARDFPFLTSIEENWEKIDGELEDLLRDRDRLPPFHKISRDQKHISKGEGWKVFILFGFGVPSARNCAQCPETSRLLRGIPGLQSAWFSILAPHYHIPMHRGITKTVLRAHLGLKIPKRREDCLMRVGDCQVTWQTGKCLVFDDFYRHEAWNNTDEERVVLIFDFNRPMRPLGALINKLLMFGIKRTAYFKDADRNLRSWDEKLEVAVMAADKMLEDDVAGV
jgi:beta-hydroxylase